MKSAVVGVLPPTSDVKQCDLDEEQDSDDHPAKPLLTHAKPRRPRPTRSAVAFFLLLTVGALSLTTEMELLPRWIGFDPQCSPATREVSAINYRSNDRFYTMMKAMKPLTPPSFRGDHQVLCTDRNADERRLEFCLPITSQDDATFCAGADRIDLLVRQSPLTLCRASVMHLLLSDVYEEMEAAGVSPSVNFSSTDEARSLATVASSGVSSISHSGDISRGGNLDAALQLKGYHLFQEGSKWRVCVAPTHPLASHVYDPDRKMAKMEDSVPHLSLIVSSRPSIALPDTMKAHPRLDDQQTCTPDVLAVKSIEYGSRDRFYMMLQTMEALPVPVFGQNHKALCSENAADNENLPFCLPMSVRNDAEFCSGADRIDLLVRQDSSTLCRGSVLHLLVADVLEDLQAAGASPIVNLGDRPDGAVTRDASITYRDELVSRGSLKLTLLRKGYHLYDAGTWRVCVAPIHPLAVNLYSPQRPALEVYAGPYLTLVPSNQLDEEVREETEALRTTERAPQETEAPSVPESGCTPHVVDVVDGGSGGEFYAVVKSSAHLAPRFHDEHEVLCSADSRKGRAFRYCLPISGRKDCANADRMDILLLQSPAKLCIASVLHMLLKDVYEELKAAGFALVLTYGTLLGAVRDGGIIPFTEDVDIAYNGQIFDGGELDQKLWRKGYHLFSFNMWRVCVAPTHPLASQLYDPEQPIVKDYEVPYADLYSMRQQFGGSWSMQELKSHRLSKERVEPFTQVSINGEQFDTIHDPNFLLLSEYGSDYMTPKPRERRLSWAKYT